MTGQSPEVNTTDLSRRMKAVADELTALHRELYWLALQNAGSSETLPLTELNVDVVGEFKFAVDSMRDLLWKYLDAASHVQPVQVGQAMEAQRLRRTTQLLQLFRERLGQAAVGEPLSFIEKISAAVKERLKDSKVA